MPNYECPSCNEVFPEHELEEDETSSQSPDPFEESIHYWVCPNCENRNDTCDWNETARDVSDAEELHGVLPSGGSVPPIPLEGVRGEGSRTESQAGSSMSLGDSPLFLKIK